VLSVLTVTENGYGKRTPLADYPRRGRGTQGVIAIETSLRNGPVVAARLVSSSDEIILITNGGVLIRTRVHEIREMGRNTQGVILIQLDEGEKLAGLEKLLESEDENGSAEAEPDNGPESPPEPPSDP
jgi:DNA gyrase subunit A